jgi:hypothetical protein
MKMAVAVGKTAPPWKKAGKSMKAANKIIIIIIIIP